jgi:hypothetical protein
MLTKKVLIAVTLLLAACNPESTPSGPAGPLGIRQALHTGNWRGPMGGTMVDFNIDISGQVMQPLPKAMQPAGYQPYFYDRPKVCSIKYDRHTFDCPHYTDMHIDNGLLCGTYTLNSSIYRPCFQPVR